MLAFSVGPCFCGLVDQGIAALPCFLWGNVLFDVSLWLAVCGLGVVALMAGALEPLSGVRFRIIIKAAPFDLPPLLFEIRALPLCTLKQSGLLVFVCRGIKGRKLL
ncbi:hypothetical protein CgunFtcFv8_013430 [Champsocephalus gunnari]|uniref:Uncharacterized protein n=1 Tax=Champsocephalus gunnari TaxID=52237 RepID=A0AAN8DSE7_CHAGU|nr:hypothetical protein CgunFtcFv8_013430 [Champsocephalus gunnari]